MTVAKRAVTYLAAGFGLLSGIALVVGGLLDGRVGLAMTGWGILSALVALVAFVVRAGPLGILRPVAGIFHLKSKVLNPATMGVNYFQTMSIEEPDSDSEVLKPSHQNSYDDLPVWSISRTEAHFNWNTGEYDPVRGLGGEYDPPYSLYRERRR